MARPEMTEPNINPLPLKKGRIHFEKINSQEKNMSNLATEININEYSNPKWKFHILRDI